MVDTVPFYSQTAILDTLIKAKNFTFSPEIVSLIAKKLRNRPHPRWAIELLKHGYFTDAPELEKAKEGFLISRWEEQEYLISVAAEAPEVVIDHCQKLHGHGYYYGRAMIAVRQLSADLIESLVPLILSWLDNPNIAPSVSLEVLSLIQLLAKNKAEAAFQLFQKVTLPQSPPNSKKIGEYFLHSSAQSIFPFDDYGEKTISKTAAILSGIDIIKTISILEEQLCKALKIESDIKGTDFKKYTFWRSAIEESGQDSREEYKDLILEAL
jgi:hypothetical protein